MEASAQTKAPGGIIKEDDKPVGQLGEDFDAPETEPPGFKKASKGENVDPVEEADALDWIMQLGVEAYTYDVPMDVTTPEGKKRVIWQVKALTNDDFRKIEEDVVKDKTKPGPMDVAVKTVAKATVYPDLTDQKFRGNIEDPEMALAFRFKFQSGLLLSMTDRIREISGYDDLAVGEATQRQTGAVKNS